MRRALPLLLLAACAETVPAPPPPPVNWASLKPLAPQVVAPPATATEKERAAAKLYLKAMAEPGCAGLAAILDEEAHFKFAGARDLHGRDAIIKAHDTIFGGFDNRSFAATRVLITESHQSLEWTMSATRAGKPVTVHGVTLLWTKDAGTISDEHLYFDEAVDKLASWPPLPSLQLEKSQLPEEAAHIALVRGALDAFEDGHENAYLDAMSEDIVVWTLESADPQRGKTAAQTYFKNMRGAIAYLSTSIENTWGIGNYVVVEYHIIGEQKRPIGTIPAAKNGLMRLPVVDVVEMRGGKMARVWRYDDPIQLVRNP